MSTQAGSILGAFNAPPVFDPEELLQLQSIAGNRAASRFIEQHRAWLQFREISTPEPNALQRQAPAGKQSTAALEAEIDALLAKVPAPPQVPAFEAITSTTAGEYSYTDWEQAMEKTWKRERLSFTQTARKVAATGGPERAVSTEGPKIAPPVPYARRWTLNLIATKYRGRKKMGHIDKFLAEGSPFAQAQIAESDQTIEVKDPTAADMRSSITDAIFGLFRDLPQGQIGELVVYFSGHGTNGRIVGVDWEKLFPAELEALANFARDWNVHIVYIIDSCRSGGFVLLSQGTALKDAEKQFKKLPAEQQAILSQQANAARALGSKAYAINQETINSSEVLRYIKAYTPANRMKMMTAFNALSTAVRDLDFLLADKIPAGTVKNQADLKKAIGDLNWGILYAYGGGAAQANKALRFAAVLLDTLNTAINTLIEGINSQLGTASK